LQAPDAIRKIAAALRGPVCPRIKPPRHPAGVGPRVPGRSAILLSVWPAYPLRMPQHRACCGSSDTAVHRLDAPTQFCYDRFLVPNAVRSPMRAKISAQRHHKPRNRAIAGDAAGNRRSLTIVALRGPLPKAGPLSRLTDLTNNLLSCSPGPTAPSPCKFPGSKLATALTPSLCPFCDATLSTLVAPAQFRRDFFFLPDKINGYS